MRAWAKGFGWISIVVAFLLFPQDSGADSLGAMRVRLVQGDVQVKIAETGEWVPASVNMPLIEGDELWVPEGSRAAIQTNNGAHVRLAEHTALQVLRMDRDSYQFHLAQGDAYVLNRAPKRSALQFDTPDASIRSFGDATFRIEVPEGETDVSVFRGSVLTESVGGTTTVRAGTMLALGADGYAELSPVPPPDGWRRWNAQRDRVVLARGSSYRYLPEELRVYSSDFDESGRWLNLPAYGYCWTPTVVVTGDWAPYRHGRWVWRGGDYVWVGYEPWGWAPYHYGRWAFVARIGWIWVPPARGDVYWAPGYVGWVRTGDHVAWVPLAPREVYYGRGNYGRYSTNITTVNITQVHVTNVYRNVNVTNSVTVVNQATFVTGRPSSVDRNVVVNVREDFARRRNIVVGSPAIRPAETSYIPVVRSIPETKRPPAAVRKIDVKDLRQSRPLVKEPDRSTLRPEAQPRPLEVRKVEKPRTISERKSERRQVTPAERSRPQQAAPPEKAKPQVAPAERGRPQQAAPPEKVRPQVVPAERGRPQPTAEPEKAKPQSAPAERGKPQQAAKPEKAKPQVAPAERGRPQPTAEPEKAKPQSAPAERGKPKASSPGKEKPKEDSTDNNSRGNPRSRAEREGAKDRR
ncbi:MAG: FecR domain-containing protein [Deltaproteobacteria bacterium]|nr:FecR domain-containing protein [Deltaproteobacteria bacterium]